MKLIDFKESVPTHTKKHEQIQLNFQILAKRRVESSTAMAELKPQNSISVIEIFKYLWQEQTSTAT